MYFYKLSASGYEEHMETTYYTETQYTQEEFEEEPQYYSFADNYDYGDVDYSEDNE